MCCVTHLVNFLLGVVEKGGEMLESTVVEDSLSLVVSAGYNVAHSSEGRGLHLDFSVREEGDSTRDPWAVRAARVHRGREKRRGVGGDQAHVR